MKCLRCGKQFNDDVKVCDECGFDFEEFKKYKKIVVENDDDLDGKQKVILTDNPILTFIFGLVSLMIGLTIFVFGLPISFFMILGFVATFSMAFYFSVKPCRIKLKPVRNFGIVMGFIGLAFTLYQSIVALLVFTGILS